MPGDGVIPIGSLLNQVESVGFVGPVEVEVLNPDVWAVPVRDLAADVHQRIGRFVTDQAAPLKARFQPA